MQILFRLGVTRKDQDSFVRSWKMHVDHLHGFELLKNRARSEPGRFDVGPLFQGDLQAVGQEVTVHGSTATWAVSANGAIHIQPGAREPKRPPPQDVEDKSLSPEGASHSRYAVLQAHSYPRLFVLRLLSQG